MAAVPATGALGGAAGAVGIGAEKAYADTAKAPKLSATSKSVVKGKSFTLKVKNVDGKKVTWKSSDKSVATVNSKGKVTTKKRGTCTITAKVAGKTLKCKVRVCAKAAKVTGLTAKVTGKNEVKLSWNKVTDARIYIINWRPTSDADKGEAGWHSGGMAYGNETSCVAGSSMMKKGKSYDFRIYAEGKGGDSGAWSKVVTVKMTK